MITSYEDRKKQIKEKIKINEEYKKVNELQGYDYDKLGLSRGIFATMTGDDAKMAESLKKQADEKGYKIEYKKDTDEWGIRDKKTNNLLGIINKKGMSQQDFKNIVRDPTNALFFVGGGGITAGLKGLKLLSKFSKVGKRGLALGSATGGADYTTNTLANLSSGNKELREEKKIEGDSGVFRKQDRNKAILTGALAPVIDLAGSGVVKGINKVIPKKIEKKGIVLTKGQETGKNKYLLVENEILRGGKGSKAQLYAIDFIEKQRKQIGKELNKKHNIDVNNPNYIKNIGQNLKNEGIKEKVKLKDKYTQLYNDIGDKISISGDDALNIVDDVENTLNKDYLQNFSNTEDMPLYNIVKESKKAIQNFRTNSFPEDEVKFKHFKLIRDKINSSLQTIPEKELSKRRYLINAKDIIDKNLLKLKEDNKLIGDSKEIEKFFDANKLKRDYHIKFDDKDKLYRTDSGAKKYIKFIDGENKYGNDFVDILEKGTAEEKLGSVKQLRRIHGNTKDKELKSAYLQTIFGDLKKDGLQNYDKIIDNIKLDLIKEDRVAKEIFTSDEIKQVLQDMEVLKKLNKSGHGKFKDSMIKELITTPISKNGLLSRFIVEPLVDNIINKRIAKKHFNVIKEKIDLTKII